MIKDDFCSFDITTTGLVLEGGAMRGVFTCGVLDYFMDQIIHFPYVVGVSAGACNGASYISNQRGRAKYSNVELLDEYHYIGLRHYLKKGNILDFDLLFDDFPNKILPFDFEAYSKTKTCFEVVISDCETGKALYLEEYQNHPRLLSMLRASSSIPFFSPITNVDGKPSLDGGICDSIPVERALLKGFDKIVVVLTRNRGYRKKKSKVKVPSIFFKKYPEILQAINNRNEVYNNQLDFLDRLEAEGKAIVIRPTETMTIGRIEKNTKILNHFYHHGYECASKVFNAINT